jgi:hypothetical protein
MPGGFKKLVRGLIREAIIASSPKPKRAKKIKPKAKITQKNSRHIPITFLQLLFTNEIGSLYFKIDIIKRFQKGDRAIKEKFSGNAIACRKITTLL